MMYDWMQDQSLINLIAVAITFALGWATKHYIEMYANSKKRISAFRKLIDDVDEALKDDAVSEAEFRQVFEDAKTLIKG